MNNDHVFNLQILNIALKIICEYFWVAFLRFDLSE